jgi:hypothetical protein
VAYDYEKKYNEHTNVSSVITDFSLANVAWLKTAMDEPSLPRTEVIAFAYAAIQPTRQFLEKFLHEVDRAEQAGEITARQHQTLRSSTHTHKELMSMTLGNESALNDETILEVLERVTNDIKEEEIAKFKAEEEAHQETRKLLSTERQERNDLLKRAYSEALKKAKKTSSRIMFVLFVTLIIGFVLSNWLPTLGHMSIPCWGIVSGIFIFILSVYYFSSSIFGVSFFDIQSRLERYFVKRNLKNYEKSLGLSFTDVE